MSRYSTGELDVSPHLLFGATTERIENHEPTSLDLAAIADEWPVIEAELGVVMAECRLAASPDEVAVRAHRRAVAVLDIVTRRSAPSRVKVRRLSVVGARRVADVGAASAAA